MIHIRTPLFFFWLSLPEAMASAVVLPLLIFLMVGATVVVAKPHGSSNKLMIRLGSSLSPTIKPTSWLSPSGLFGFGFYQQGDGFAVGIWLLGHPHNIVVWTAERDDPPVSSNATLVLTKDGMLLLRNDGRANGGKPIVDLAEHAVSASMLDSGNFVIYGRSSEAIWESFNYPTDSILGGQNLNGDLLSSASESNRSSGSFMLKTSPDLAFYPAYSGQSYSDAYWTITKNPSADQLSLTRTGLLYLGLRSVNSAWNLANISYSISENERVVYRATLETNGMLKLYAHIFSPQNRPSHVRLRWSVPDRQCDVKGFCGFNSFCSSGREADDANITTGASCSCYPGFAYISPNETSQGCYRNFSDTDNYCREKEWQGLFKVEVMSNNSWGGSAYSAVSIEEDQDCSKSCLEDCYCAAALFKNLTCYKYKLPIVYGLGNQSTATRAFIKVDSRIPLPHTGSNGSHYQIVLNDGKKSLILVLAVSLGSLLLLSSLVSVCVLVAYYCRGYRKLSAQSLALTQDFGIHQFSYDELEKATCGFKEKLGRGSSSGEVYRGSLFDGRRSVAVKKLARVMREGERDFCSEMMAIGRTHHKNLVRLIGFCVDGSRKFLVYEYMSNGSLAELLFKGDGRPVWEERRRMAVDVARGIYYLHEECEARIIHCDIKAENILIDDSWTAKISDFGLAKLLPPNESGIATGIKETRGLAPEWRKNVVVSVKADIYSYGVLLLEVICCRRNLEVNVSSPDEVIISTWAYQCFVDGQLEKLVGDEEVVDMQILGRMVKVALLCIQEDPDLRPPMKNVILMLEGTMNIPLPPTPFP